MQTLTRIAALAGVLALSVTGVAHTAQHSFADQDIVGYVYVNDNTAVANTVAGFAEHQDGSLTALAGSPFTVGGVGLGSGLGSQDAVQATRDGRYLLVADGGSNQISVLNINADGSLVPVPNSPFASGGTKPVSIAVHRNLVYVANDGASATSTPANYAGFSLNSAGQLAPLASAPVQVPSANNDLGDVLINRSGTNLIGIEVASSLIDSFAVTPQGALSADTQVPAQGAGPFGSAFRPTDPSQLYVSNAHNGGTNLGTVSAFSVAANGALSPIGASPFGDQQNAPCWVAIAPDGQYLFAANAGSGTISSYTINFDGSLTLLGDLPMPGTGPAPLDLHVDPRGRNLYGIDNGPKAVSIIHLHDGYMLASPTSPLALPAGATPSGITVVGIGSIQD
jgi:6-phosphogluconolactonase (cycloisomerase 2 family)